VGHYYKGFKFVGMNQELCGTVQHRAKPLNQILVQANCPF